MAAWANLTHFFSARTKKTNLYYLAVAVVLCSIFYMIGIWKQGGGSEMNSATLLPSLPCRNENGPLKPDENPSLDTTGDPLDFVAHHTADLLVPPSPETRGAQFPPCKPEFSEYTPCQDSERSLKFDREMLVYRERHCPVKKEVLKCRIPAPHGYKTPFRWPESRDSVWYANVPHKHLTVEKAGQNWVVFKGDRFGFPGGGTMFRYGADAYIDDIGKLINLKDGSVRTAIDTGCGVASWGAYLLSRNILPVSFAPKDTHEAQVQFALERGVPALIGILATQRLPYPSRAFDIAHCSRCLIPWTIHGGLYLIEVDRILRPGGYWILSEPPINWENHWEGWNRTREDLHAEQTAIEDVARSLCWKKLAQKNDLSVWQKAKNHLDCGRKQTSLQTPAFCQDQDPDTAWYTKMESCLSPLPQVQNANETSGGELSNWPERLTAVPPRVLSGSVEGVTTELFQENTELWKKRVSHYKALDPQLAEAGRYRNLLDMNAYLGGFAAALVDDPSWVMNAVPVEADVNTLGVVFERGLIGIYHNWCEAMSTYPRTYDFIHADHVFTLYKDRCEAEEILLEMDRTLRPQGGVIIRDDVDVLTNIKGILDGLEWSSRMTDHEDGPHVREKVLVATKQYWTSPAPAQVEETTQ